MTDPKKLWQVPEAASQLSISERTMARLIKDGEVETVKIGRRRLVPDVALETYIKRLRASA